MIKVDNYKLRAFLLMAGTFLAISCQKEIAKDEFTDYKPVLIERDQLNATIKLEGPRKLSKPGKLYIKGNLLYISEVNTGIHIYDNSDKTNPINLAFIRVPGTLDMAVRNNTLFVDNATDLVGLSLDNFNELEIVSRTANVFPEPLPPDGLKVPTAYTSEKRPSNTVIIDWIK